MTDTEILRPTPERTRKADHLADDGQPTKDQPYIRAARLGTAWDRYKRDRDGQGRLLADSEMILTRSQIATGEDYISNYHKGMWGGPSGSKYEPGVSGAFSGPPAHQLDCQKAVWKLEAKVNPRRLVVFAQSVLIDGQAADGVAKAYGYHPKAGIELLRVVLDMMGGE